MTSKTLATGALAALLWTTAAAAQEVGTAPDPAPLQTAEEPAEVAPPPAAPTVTEAILGGKLILDARARYETVEQVGIAQRASAFTLRTRLGWETADFHGWRGLVEFDDVRQLGGERYNVAVPGVAGGSLNGKTLYPIINDPEVTELNRAQLTWAPTGWANFTLGRQRILIEDQRFVGNLGWRQDEQTFDGLRADLSYGKLKALYTYVSHINRSLGEARDWDSDSHLFNLTYTPSEAVRLHGFLYALDFDNAKANNNLTYGGKLSGKTWVSQVQILYNATYAHQRDYRHETPAYRLDYWGGDLTATYDIYSVKGSYEVLEGNGTRGFITPLATTHLFNGWADAWAGVSGNKTFVDGIEDANLQLTLRPRRRWAYLFNIEFLGRYHDFDDQRTGASLAHEWDFQAQAAITNYLSIAAKYADFKREATVPAGTAAPPASRNKFWFTVQYLF
jgi:hypothetical protein